MMSILNGDPILTTKDLLNAQKALDRADVPTTNRWVRYVGEDGEMCECRLEDFHRMLEEREHE